MLLCKAAPVRSKVKKEDSVTNNCHPQLRKNINVLRLPLTAQFSISGSKVAAECASTTTATNLANAIAVNDIVSEQLPSPSAVAKEPSPCPICRLQRPIHNP